MATEIIDGKKIASNLRTRLKKVIASLSKKPKLAVILVGDNPASLVYVNHKVRVAEELGVDVELHHLSPVMTNDTLVSFVRDLNNDPDIDGILVQLPLPGLLRADEVIQQIDPEKDVDGLHYVNLGKLFTGHYSIVPCTPLACMALIKSVVPKLDGLNAVVVGRSNLVGRPLAQLLLDENCTVTQAHSKTRDLAEVTSQADILVSATGHAGLIRKKHVKRGAVVIDVGISKLPNGKLSGDVLFGEVFGHAGFLTPVPGGVGPMTVAMLFQNIVQIVQNKLAKQKKNDILLKNR